MKASKWVHPTTGQVRVYITGACRSSSIKAYAIDDGEGYAEVIIEGDDGKIARNAKCAVREHYGRYAKFAEYLAAAAADANTVAPKAKDTSYGSAYANGFAAANGYYADEA